MAVVMQKKKLLKNNAWYIPIISHICINIFEKNKQFNDTYKQKNSFKYEKKREKLRVHTHVYKIFKKNNHITEA